MSNHCLSYRRLVTVSGFFALGIAVSGSAVAAPYCRAADVRTLEMSPQNLCEGTANAAAGNGQASYHYQSLDFPNAVQTIFWGLNDAGDLAGQYSLDGVTAHAMTYRHGQFAPLDPDMLGSTFSAAGGPTDVGSTFGGYADTTGLQHGFVIRLGQFETVDFPNHLNSNVDGVNLFGTLLGVYWDADRSFHGILRRNGTDTAFDVDGAVDTYPLGLNNKGQSVGYWDAGSPVTHGYYRGENGQITTVDVPNASSTAAFGINDRGQIAGYFVDASGAVHGFVKTGPRFQQLDMPGVVATIPTAINNSGSVAGEYVDTSGVRHGFIATLN